ncbi:hypothetical protein GGR57DRAFT_502410 [Xylariaceae sp. FL1272]|nr:hypothetical protein GGR57DRAFT_502410 [Xylariaceae sp. FL1272]
MSVVGAFEGVDFSVEFVVILPESPEENRHRYDRQKWEARVTPVLERLQQLSFWDIQTLQGESDKNIDQWRLAKSPGSADDPYYGRMEIYSPVFDFMNRDQWQAQLKEVYDVLFEQHCQISTRHEACVVLYLSRDTSSPDIEAVKLFADTILRFNFRTRLRPALKTRGDALEYALLYAMVPPLGEQRAYQDSGCRWLRSEIQTRDSVAVVDKDVLGSATLDPGNYVDFVWLRRPYYSKDIPHSWKMKAGGSSTWKNLARSVDIACLLLMEALSVKAGRGWLQANYGLQEDLKPDALYQFMEEQLVNLRSTCYPEEDQTEGREFIDEEIRILQDERTLENAFPYEWPKNNRQ